MTTATLTPWSSTMVCERARISYRQLDYLIRTGALEPTVSACGSGTHRRFSDVDVLAAAVAGDLRARGARTDVVLRAVTAVKALPPTPGVLVVSQDGVEVAFFSDDELEEVDLAELVRLVSSGWAVRVPPLPLDADSLAG